MKLFLDDDLGKITIEVKEPSSPKATVIIAHGAGAGMHHPFMLDLADQMAVHGFRAVRFNFPYMEGGRKAPGSPKKNIEAWNLVTKHIVAQYPGSPIFLSGKSYGGRMASHFVATDNHENVKGLIYFGFPLHAPGRDSKDRAAHLGNVDVPQLFLQGTKDKLANIQMIGEVVDELKTAEIITLEDADHSFNVPKRVGLSKKEMIERLAKYSVDFINKYL